MNIGGGQIIGALFNIFFNDHNGSEDDFLIDGKLVWGKLLKKVNVRHWKWPIEKWAFTKTKPRNERKNILTKKMTKQYHRRCSRGSMVYLKRIYIALIATLVILRRKWELPKNIFRTMRVQNEKKEKGAASLLNFCNDHLEIHCIYLVNTFKGYFRLKLSRTCGGCPQWLTFSKNFSIKSCKDAMSIWGGQFMGAISNSFVKKNCPVFIFQMLPSVS